MLINRAAGILLALSLLVSPAWAKNFAVPDKDPAVVISIPDNWTTEEIAYGYSAQSPGKDVFFSVEFAGADEVKKMLENNDKWMKENNIKKVPPNQAEMPLNGIPTTVFQYVTTDENGPTTVEFVLMAAGKKRMIMLTLWGSVAEREKHGKAIDAIMSSVRPIN